MSEDQRSNYIKLARQYASDPDNRWHEIETNAKEGFINGAFSAHNLQQEKIATLESRNEELTAKAGKWDKLSKQIDGFYKDGSGADLVDIGEACAEAFGYF